MNVFWIAVAAFMGGILAALAGWLETQDSFNPRKFGASVVRALVAAIGIAVAYTYANGLSALDIAMALLAGAGVDVLGNRVAGAITARRR